MKINKIIENMISMNKGVVLGYHRPEYSFLYVIVFCITVIMK